MPTPSLTVLWCAFADAMQVARDTDRFGELVPSLMIVDGDADSRLLCHTVLVNVSQTLLEAEDGVEALEKARSCRPDVIVLDTHLLGIDGYSLCSLLRQDRRTNGAGIVIVTAAAYPADIARAQRAGADEVLVKPYVPDDLVVAVCRTWRRRQAAARMRAPQPVPNRDSSGTVAEDAENAVH
jgi:CheY-like chemotaxis protein